MYQKEGFKKLISTFIKIDKMLIQNKQLGYKGIFFIEDGVEKMAELTYSVSEGNLTIHHTEVNQKLKGKNIGGQLVNYAVSYAREHQLKIIPVCPFALAMFEKKKRRICRCFKKPVTFYELING